MCVKNIMVKNNKQKDCNEKQFMVILKVPLLYPVSLICIAYLWTNVIIHNVIIQIIEAKHEENKLYRS